MTLKPEMQQIVDALVINSRDPELERDLARKAYWRAFEILDLEEPMRRRGINWCSDDDPIHDVKQLVVPYNSEQGGCTLVLTNFFQWPRPSGTTVDKGIRLEVYKTPVSVSEHEDQRWFHGHGGEVLFALDDEGNMDSPLGFVDPNIAHSLIHICEEDHKRQQAERAEASRSAPVA